MHRHTCIDYITNCPFDILQCCDCGLFITPDAPDSNNIIQFYPKSDFILQPDATKGVFNRAYGILRNSWLKQKAKITEKQSHRLSGVLLDIGCKYGDFIATMRRKGWIAHGLECNPYAREYGHAHFGLDIGSQQQLLHIQPKSYNVVTSWDSIGEFQDLNRDFSAMCNLVVSDGTLIVAFPDASSPAANLYKEQWFSWDVPRKRWHFSPQAFEQLTDKHGMTIANRKRYAGKSLGTCVMSEWMANGKTSRIMPLLKSVFQLLANRTLSANSEYIVYTLKHKQQNGLS